MKKYILIILSVLLCLTLVLSGCKKEEPAIEEAKAVIEATEEIRKDPAATTVTVVTTTQTGKGGATEEEPADTEPENSTEENADPSQD